MSDQNKSSSFLLCAGDGELVERRYDVFWKYVSIAPDSFAGALPSQVSKYDYADVMQALGISNANTLIGEYTIRADAERRQRILEELVPLRQGRSSCTAKRIAVRIARAFGSRK